MSRDSQPLCGFALSGPSQHFFIIMDDRAGRKREAALIQAGLTRKSADFALAIFPPVWYNTGISFVKGDWALHAQAFAPQMPDADIALQPEGRRGRQNRFHLSALGGEP